MVGVGGSAVPFFFLCLSVKKCVNMYGLINKHVNRSHCVAEIVIKQAASWLLGLRQSERVVCTCICVHQLRGRMNIFSLVRILLQHFCMARNRKERNGGFFCGNITLGGCLHGSLCYWHVWLIGIHCSVGRHFIWMLLLLPT